MKKNTYEKIIICLILTLVSLILAYTICEPIAFYKELSLQEKLDNSLFLTTFFSFTIFSFVMWNFIIELIIRLQNKEKKALCFIKHFSIYFSIMFIILILIWPGHWVWDEMYVIEYTQSYSVYMWQSVLTQIYYAIALLIFPNVVGIVILQIFLISIVIAYIQTMVETIYNKKIFNIILYILFLIPSIIANNLYILRLPIYSYIALLFFAIVIFNHIQKNTLTTKKIIVLILLSIIMALWRSEGIIFIIFVPLIIAFSYNKLKIALKMSIISVIILTLSYVSFNKIFEKYEDKVYSLLIFVNPLSNMLQEDININSEDIETIDKVMNVELIKQNPSYTETPAYWNGGLIRKNYEENLSDFTKTYIKIVLKNPISFTKSRIATFIATSGMDKEFLPHVNNRFLYNLVGTQENEFIQQFCTRHKGLNPIFKDLKIDIESLLVGENPRNMEQNQLIKVVFWNFIPILIAIFIIGITSLVKKKWLIALICISLLAKSGIVFLTAPANYFMYYLPEYIIGFLLICVTIYEKINNDRSIKNDRIIKEK